MTTEETERLETPELLEAVEEAEELLAIEGEGPRFDNIVERHDEVTASDLLGLAETLRTGADQLHEYADRLQAAGGWSASGVSEETEELLDKVGKALMARQEELPLDWSLSDQAVSDQGMRWGIVAENTLQNLDWLLRGDPASEDPNARALIDAVYLGEEIAQERAEKSTEG